MSGLDFPSLIGRMIQQESGGNPNAVSPVGAMGLMQVMPATAADPGYGIAPLTDPMDPAANRAFGEQYMRAMLNKFGGDQARALVAYNWGPGNAEGWDGNMASLPDETRGYVAAILGGSPYAPATSPRPLPAPAAPMAALPFAPMTSPRPLPRPAAPSGKEGFAQLIADVEQEKQAQLYRAAHAGQNLYAQGM